DFEVTSSPDDTVSCLAFSPSALPGNFMIAGSWAHDDNGQTVPKAQQMHSGPVQDVCWSDLSRDKMSKMWDLNRNQEIQVAQAYPMAVVTSADYGLIVYQLKNQLLEFRRIESTLKHQHHCVAIFKDKQNKTCWVQWTNGRNAITPQDIYSCQNQAEDLQVTGPTNHRLLFQQQWQHLSLCLRL
ncbi:hypothetical protein Z043_109482, partial [Scleropages formosus]